MILPLVARFLDEVVSPLLRLAFFTALEVGVFPDVPPEAALLREQDVELQYYSPLALAAQRNKVNGTMAALEALAPVAQATGDASLLDVFNLDNLARDLARSYGAFPEHLRSVSEVKKLRELRAQAQQQADAAAQMAEIAKSQNLTGPVDRTSVAGELVNGRQRI